MKSLRERLDAAESRISSVLDTPESDKWARSREYVGGMSDAVEWVPLVVCRAFERRARKAESIIAGLKAKGIIP